MGSAEANGLTGAEAQIAAMRIQGLSFRKIGEALGKSAATILKHAHKPHVHAAIVAGSQRVVDDTAAKLTELRILAADTLADLMANSDDESIRAQTARDVLKVTEPRKAEVKVDGVGDLIRAAVREMSDEELGVCDD